MILVVDTETNGRVDFKAPYYAPQQPRMLSVCALLYSDDGKLVNQLSAVVDQKTFVQAVYRLNAEPKSSKQEGTE
jgi:hypothetical protein